jgi:hypothetical protein
MAYPLFMSCSLNSNAWMNERNRPLLTTSYGDIDHVNLCSKCSLMVAVSRGRGQGRTLANLRSSARVSGRLFQGLCARGLGPYRTIWLAPSVATTPRKGLPCGRLPITA